ncbi:hypothetical protein KR222_010667, partial [Zaprionus bogoriensis]
DGIQFLKLREVNPFHVLCERSSTGPSWMIIQRRFNGKVNFYRSWEKYKNGFGKLDSEFFTGLEKLYLITKEHRHELLIQMTDLTNTSFYAHYDNFTISDEVSQYTLKSLGNYSGNATDAMNFSLEQPFSTYDQLNDVCALKYKAAWWFNANNNCGGR